MKPTLDEQLHKAFQLHQAGELRNAEVIYRRILAKSPKHIDANNLLGLLCIQTKRSGLAVKWIETALREDSDNAQAHYNLGMAYKELDRLNDAASHFRRATELTPQNAEAHNALGSVLRAQGRPDQAVACYEKALALQPAHAGIRRNFGCALNDLGVAKNRLGQSAEAIAHFRHAVQMSPNDPEALINLGISLEQTGCLEDAVASYKEAISAKPAFAGAHYHLAHLRNHHSSKAEISAMQMLFEKSDTSNSERILLAYGLGEALHKQEEYDRAFASFEAGHGLKKKTASFSLADQTRFFELLQNVFGADFFKEHIGKGYDEKTPIFVIGMPRSGTSLTEQILASHSDVHGAGELPYVSELTKETARITASPFPKSMTTVSTRDLHTLGVAYIEKLRGQSEKALHITDTTPMNFLYAGLIASALPNARIVHCTRNPMDTCLSIFMHPLSNPHAYAHELEDLGAYYMLYDRLMEHWHDMMPGRIHNVIYETMVTDSESAIRGLLDYCELPFEEACLNFHQTDRVVRTPSAGQVRQPIYQDSIQRWKRYDKHLGPLKDIFGVS